MSEDRKDCLDILRHIVMDIVGHENFELNLETKATDIEGWDSLSHVQIIHECETYIGVKFSLEEITNLNTVGDLISLMKKNSE